MLARACAIGGLVAVVLGSPRTATTQSARDLAEVLRRAGVYVEEFQRQLSGIVAEETYEQEVVPTIGPGSGRPIRPERRLLRSDLLLLRPAGAKAWVQYRDVLAVDGRPVRDREERLTTLLMKPGRSGADRAQQIRAESARYNIGRIRRTMNVPVLPLEVLAPRRQSRFRFALDDTGTRRSSTQTSGLPSSPHFHVSVEGWIVTFEERRGPTLVQTFNGGDVFSRGRFWLEPETGRVLASEMVAEGKNVTGTLQVSYQSEPLLGFLVPIQLRETYTQVGYGATIVGEATYGNFRRVEDPAARATATAR